MFKAKLVPEDHCRVCLGRHTCIHVDRSIRINCANYRIRPRRVSIDMLDAITRRSLYEAVEGDLYEEL